MINESLLVISDTLPSGDAAGYVTIDSCRAYIHNSLHILQWTPVTWLALIFLLQMTIILFKGRFPDVCKRLQSIVPIMVLIALVHSVAALYFGWS